MTELADIDRAPIGSLPETFHEIAILHKAPTNRTVNQL